jgi:colanic acid biosynthesis glycosyl transferase WcaI
LKLLLLTPYYDPEPFGIAVVATGLATYMAERGWQTTVLSGMPKTPQWEIYPEFRGKLLHREKRGRVDILRTWIYCPKRPAAVA